ncbi:MAG TPA: NAD(P)-dependent alcohol dehydrogenase [Chitinophagaceae bacterium]|nr:NAD(P)-dependent alcohol dehydrogenase [Chitinophagaceae bacterium]
MKVAFRSKYGLPRVLSIKEIEIPIPKDDEVLIKVYAATANRSDYHILTGRPFLMRLFTGLFKPKLATTGTDFAGQVEATGKDVTCFKTGDKVMGFSGGLIGISSHAQYLVLPETKATKITVNIPANLQYDEAAACLEGAFYAVGNTLLNLKAGQKVLIYGATGAIGSSYVQFLKLYGLSITAVCRGEHFDMVKSLGADRVIDYTKNDFTKDTEKYDYVFDAVGKTSFAKCKRLLKKNGIYTSSGGAENLLLVLITPLFGGKKVVFKPPKNIKTGLSFIKKLIEEGRFRPLIDRKYPIDKIAEAFTYVASGQKIGNVIITMHN